MDNYTFNLSLEGKITAVAKPSPTQEIIIALVQLFKFLMKE